MGQIRFRLPQADLLSDEALRCAYLAGMEGIPWQSNHVRNGLEVLIHRSMNESGNLFVPWEVEGHGLVMLSTASCMERAAEYQLPVELARGTLVRLKNFAFEWSAANLVEPPGFAELLVQASRAFVEAATNQRNPATAASHAQRSIKSSLDAIDLIGSAYSEYMISLRHQSEPKLSTMIAVNVGCHAVPTENMAPAFAAFNSVAIPFSWRDIEAKDGEYDWTLVDAHMQWARQHGLRICAGPMVQLDRHHLPDWIYLWEESFDEIQASATRFVQASVERYKDHVHVWHSAARFNLDGALSMTEEEHLRLAVAAISAVRSVDTSTPIVLSFDRPWGDYLAHQSKDLSPFHFADTIVRAELGLAGIGLEFNLGYWPEGSLHRDRLEFNRQLDRWAMLGTPLIAFITAPSSDVDDNLAQRSARPATACDGAPTPQSQQAIAESIIPLFLAKPMIHGIVWNQLTDQQHHDFPHGGVIDSTGQPKPIIDSLVSIRKQHLR